MVKMVPLVDKFRSRLYQWYQCYRHTAENGADRVPDNRRYGRWQSATKRLGQTICVGGQVGHGIQPLKVPGGTGDDFQEAH